MLSLGCPLRARNGRLPPALDNQFPVPVGERTLRLDFEGIRVQQSDGVTTFSIEAPPLNLLSRPIIKSLVAAFGEVAGDTATRCVVLKGSGTTDPLWSCPAAIASTVGNVVQSLQSTSTLTNAAVTRYWAWRFDRPDDPVGQEDFWGKTVSQAVADLVAVTNDPALGIITSACDVELCVDSYFPNTIPSVAPELSGRTVHPGGRSRVMLDGHAIYIKDKRTPW